LLVVLLVVELPFRLYMGVDDDDVFELGGCINLLTIHKKKTLCWFVVCWEEGVAFFLSY